MNEVNIPDQSDIVTIRIHEEMKKSNKRKHKSKAKTATGISTGVSTSIGTRKSQQDSVFVHSEGKTAIGIVCDGMGGMDCGEVASQMAVETLATDYFEEPTIEDLPAFFRREAVKIDAMIASLQNEDGSELSTGTTIVAAAAQDNRLFWLTVGDSQLYIIRGKEILAVNKLHNYRLTLDQMLRDGDITEEEYLENESRAEALISYLGMGNVSLMEINQNPFLMCPGDVIVMCSDGLYRELNHEQIRQIVEEHMGNPQEAAVELTAMVTASAEAARRGQDNTSVVLMKYQ